MMDALDHLAAPAVELLARVDTALAQTGAPDDHPIWPLLRRLRALPGEAVGALVGVRPAPLATAGSVLHTITGEYVETRASLPAELGWQGASAEGFATQWAALRTHLDTGGPDGLAGRLHDTASYVDALRSWVVETREAVARTVAVVLTSAEAVTVRLADPGDGPVSGEAAGAAADIAARVLTCLVEAHDRGERLLADWSPRLTELSYRPPAAAVRAGFDATTEVHL
jgi:hypothetical protein